MEENKEKVIDLVARSFFEQWKAWVGYCLSDSFCTTSKGKYAELKQMKEDTTKEFESISRERKMKFLNIARGLVNKIALLASE